LSTLLVSLVLEPLQYPFMLRALYAVLLVGTIAAVVGSFVVLRGMAFFGDALAHAVLPGLAVGYVVSGGQTQPLFWWALLTAVLAAVGIGVISRAGDLREDTAIGIVFAGMLALGVALISTTEGYAVDLTHILFGNVLAMSKNNLLLLGSFAVLIALVLALSYKELLVFSFDPVFARVVGLPTSTLHYTLLVLLAATTVVCLQTVGVALMLAMLVTPAATAYLFSQRVPAMMGLAAVFGAFSGVAGLYLSYYTQVASGAAVVLVATVVFLAGLVLRRWLRG
jgi:manganese/iron transport system permease protein